MKALGDFTRELASPALVNQLMGAPASCLFFGSYESLKYLFRQNRMNGNDMLINFMSGMGAEAISCVLWLPIDVIKERLQVQAEIKTYQYTNAMDALRQITKKEGVLGLYRAYGATVIAFGPFIATNLTMYEKAKQLFGFKQDVTMLQNFVVAFFTGSIASLVTNPMDIAKVRMQVQRAEMSSRGDNILEKGRFAYRNVFHGMYRLTREEGMLALWKGCTARVLYMSAQAAINLSLLDKIRSKLLQRQNSSSK
jgi:hypothetical protein